MSEAQQTISQILRAARQERGLDIDTVYRNTSISLPVLNGMENDRFDIIEPVFSRMALLSYADYLGLDPQPLLDRFDQETGPIFPPIPEAATAPQTTTPGLRLPIPLDSTILRTIGLGFGTLVILLLAISLFNGLDAPPAAHGPPPEPAPVPRSVPAPPPQPVVATRPEPTPPPAASTTTPSPAPIPRESPASQATPPPTDAPADARPAPEATTPVPPAATPAPVQIAETAPVVDAANEDRATIAPPTDATAAPAEPPPGQHPATPPARTDAAGIVLAVEAVDSTWVQIHWDDTGQFQGIVPRGERRSWQADDHFLVFTGRAHGLRYWLNDELLGNGQLGAATQVLRFRANTSGIEFLGPNFQPLTSEATTDQP